MEIAKLLEPEKSAGKKGAREVKNRATAHPEMPDGHSGVSRSEMRNFVQDQEKQGFV